jgi:hypothetical protein
MSLVDELREAGPISPVGLHLAIMEIEVGFRLKPIGLPGTERTIRDLKRIIRRARAAIEFLKAAQTLMEEYRTLQAEEKIAPKEPP